MITKATIQKKKSEKFQIYLHEEVVQPLLKHKKHSLKIFLRNLSNFMHIVNSPKNFILNTPYEGFSKFTGHV